VGFSDISSGGKSVNPSQSAGLRAGDRIISVNGEPILSSFDLTRQIEESKGNAISIVYLRDGKRYTASLSPVYCQKEKCYKSGIYVKDNGAGIGTVTYIDPETLSFGGLGHGICESESGSLIPIQRGSVLGASINGAVKGRKGVPGEVKGSFKAGKIGTLLKNTDCGVYGVYARLPDGLPTEPLELCSKDELSAGKAYIWCTLDEKGPQRYEIEISNINRESTEGRSFTVKVTDPALLQKTGGIVQGMSGSPIIQNGKLVGAVTHVLVGDPTRGYGIFIENMLAAAE
jgi:stage IV sporulation protein B